MTEEPKLKHVAMWICEPCLAGEGLMCHTPGCALIRHHVDLPIPLELYEEVDASAQGVTERELLAYQERIKLQAEMIERWGAEREAVARAVFGEGWKCCANLGPYVQSIVSELNELRATHAETAADNKLREAIEDEVEKWSNDPRSSYPATEVADSFIRIMSVPDEDAGRRSPAGCETKLQDALAPFLQAARTIAKRPQDYKDRIASIGGLEDACDLMKRHFADLLAAVGSSQPDTATKPEPRR